MDAGQDGKSWFTMTKPPGTPRRAFLQRAALAAGAAAQAPVSSAPSPQTTAPGAQPPDIAYPRVFEGRQLAMIAFPLGGVGAGAVSLGGRGQLRDWEIFNRPDKGYRAVVRLPRASGRRPGKAKPVARVLESRILPPYEGERPRCRQRTRPPHAWRPPRSPASIRWRASTSLTAPCPSRSRSKPSRRSSRTSPTIPVCLSPCSATALTNPGRAAPRSSIAWSLENPDHVPAPRAAGADQRRNETPRAPRVRLTGLLMTNPGLDRRAPHARHSGLVPARRRAVAR